MFLLTFIREEFASILGKENRGSLSFHRLKTFALYKDSVVQKSIDLIDS